MSLKRKSPYGSMSSSPAPGARGASAGVKLEQDVKRIRGSGYITPATYSDPRTAVLELKDYLKDRITMAWQDAYFHVEDRSPGVDVTKVLEVLKTQDRVKFNETNQVYTYEPEIVLRTQADLRSHIRTHSRPTHGLPWKELKELMPGPELPGMLEELERDGQVMILRSLTGKMRDAPLPELGRENAWGEKLNGGGQERWRMVFWDDIKERGRAADRVDDEFVFAWADVKIAETDDVAKLLEGQDLKASSVVPAPAKKDDGDDKKAKKKRRGRALKLTNTHMKDLGFDFSKDYEAA